jgi:N-acetylmuramoyl-L-alanine amidase
MLPDLPPMPPVEIDPLPYEQKLDARPLSQIDLVVVHCTETPTLASAREFGERVL